MVIRIMCYAHLIAFIAKDQARIGEGSPVTSTFTLSCVLLSHKDLDSLGSYIAGHGFEIRLKHEYTVRNRFFPKEDNFVYLFLQISLVTALPYKVVDRWKRQFIGYLF